MIAQKKDIFKTPLPAPLVGTGSTAGELEKRVAHIKKHSSTQDDASSPAAQKKRNTATAEAKVRELSRKSSQVLYQLKTVFPFDFFPDTITVNANKIDVIQSFFFFSSNTTSVPIRDIANVEVETTPFFATLKLINIRAPMRPISISYLKKHEAKKAKNIIDGLLVATEQGADVSNIEPKNFLPQIEKLGQSFEGT